MTTALVPMGDMVAMAQAVCKSGLFAAVKSPDATLTLLLLAQAEGLHPMQAMRRFDIVDGKPSMKSDAMLGEFQQHGGRVKWVTYEDAKVTAVFTSPGCPDGLEVSWDMDRARRAGLGGKRNWQTYPRQMLRARVISEGVRATMPGVVAGLYTPEEVEDFSPLPRGKVIDVQPAAEALPAWAEPVPEAPPLKTITVEVVPTPPASAAAPAPVPETIGAEGAKSLRLALAEAMPRHDDELVTVRAQTKRWGEWLAGVLGRKLSKLGDLETITREEAAKVASGLKALVAERERREVSNVA